MAPDAIRARRRHAVLRHPRGVELAADRDPAAGSIPARAGTPCTEGLGPRLVEAAEAHCRAAGRRHLELDIVDLRTELPPFCAKLGFSPCGPAACGTAPCGTAPCSDPQKSKRPASMILMTEPLAG